MLLPKDGMSNNDPLKATTKTRHSTNLAVVCSTSVTFKMATGQVICVVKVINHDLEVLMSMYKPLLDAVVEQHQFIPDTIVFVDESVSTSRRISDGVKPRDIIGRLYATERLYENCDEYLAEIVQMECCQEF